MSTMLLALATPMRLTKSRIAAGGTPRRRKPGERRHARIVPAADMAAAHEFGEHALRQHRVGEIEPRELVLVRVRGHRQVVQKPVVERPMVLEFERADRMGDALDGVRLAVGEIVARINAPGRAGARMLGVQDAVEHRIAQVDVARGHVDLGAQHARAVGKFAGAHAAEQIEIFLDANARDTGCRCRPRSRCRALPASPPGSGRRHRPCRRGSDARPIRRAARNNPTRDKDARPNRSRASARRARWRRYIPAPPWSGWCRRSADGSGRRIPRRCRNSGRSTWRGRYAGSRSAPAESG